jgi:hypothetical protein
MDFKRVKISTTVPAKDADQIRDALGKAGSGIVGEYSFCSFSSKGIGRFKPTVNANPYIGRANELTAVEEEQIEVVCSRSIAKRVIAALKAAHPYEEVIVDITPLIDEDQL